MKLTKVRIANTKDIGISRKTLYNDKVVQKYIDESINEQINYLNLDKIIALQYKYDELEEQYNKIINNIVETSILKELIIEYEEKIHNLIEQNENLRLIIFENNNINNKIKNIIK